ncbi:MAG: type II secretion system protein, partial [Synergistaceae bacterium]|nr:type II secretion system protein [Synergistaceae bacterium]
MKSMKRKGFTLVELLIVIVVIGILSSMMMMSSTEAVTSARASNIVSNLRNLKTAALAYYTDHLDAVTGSPNWDIAKSHDEIFQYL